MSKTIAYNIDCMEYMATLPDKAFDLAIVDPPYGIGADLYSNDENLNRGGKKRTESTTNRLNRGAGKLKNRFLNKSDCSWDSKPPTWEYFSELFRVSKNQIIWGGNYFPLNPTRCLILWDKMQPWENFSQFELAWTSFDKPTAKLQLSNRGGANKEIKIHPTQKPIKLYSWLLNKFANKGDKILDTHLGSGSSRIAAHKLGFEFVGCELDKDYFEAQEKRFKLETMQQNLFV